MAQMITVYDSIPSYKKYEITMQSYLTILNSITISKNALEICNFIGCLNTELRCLSAQYTLTYRNIFSSDSNNNNYILSITKLSIKPIINTNLYKSIIFMKWKLHEFKKTKTYDNSTAEWIGALSGLVYYFSELDELNNNKTNNALLVCRDLTMNDIL